MTKLTGLLVAACLCSATLPEAKADLVCNPFTPNYKTKSDIDCHHYISCDNGVLTTKTCPWLQKFDPAKTTCKLTGANCGAQPAPIPEPWPAFDCQGRPNFKTTSPWGCRHYIQCSGGLLSVQECSIWNPKFDPSTQECRPLVLNVCQQRPFPPPDATTTAGPSTTTGPTPSGPTPSGPTPSGPTPSGPTPSEHTPSEEPKPTPTDESPPSSNSPPATSSTTEPNNMTESTPTWGSEPWHSSTSLSPAFTTYVPPIPSDQPTFPSDEAASPSDKAISDHTEHSHDTTPKGNTNKFSTRKNTTETSVPTKAPTTTAKTTNPAGSTTGTYETTYTDY